MKISTKTRYAIRLLLETARIFEGNRLITMREVSKKQDISEKYIESIASKLRKAGYLASYKGVGGGYRLIKKPEDITVGEIMRLMESTYFDVHCSKDACDICVNYKNCTIADAWGVVEESISSVVDNVSIANLLNNQLPEFA